MARDFCILIRLEFCYTFSLARIRSCAREFRLQQKRILIVDLQCFNTWG